MNMHEAKTELSRLVERALKGEEVVIARAGVPVVPLSGGVKRKLGHWAGKVWMSEDFDDPLSDQDLDAIARTRRYGASDRRSGFHPAIGAFR